MNEFVNFQGIPINYQDIGSGKVVVLLHGYLESLEIWGQFAEELAKNFRVLSIDLLGHGKSGTFADCNSMELMADATNCVLEHLQIETCCVIGHSLGGYVTLAFTEHYAHKLFAFSLFHSSPFADSDEKKGKRSREIELVKALKKMQLFANHVPNTFATDNLERFSQEIEFAKQIAQQTTEQGIIATLEGMKQRKDRSNVLKNSDLPFLYVIGKKDNFIPIEILSKIEFPQNTTILTLENSGHQGFIEEREKSVEVFRNFIESN